MPGGRRIVTDAKPAVAEPQPLGVTGNLLVALGGFVLVAPSARGSRATGPSGRPERDVFHAINDLPDWMYRILWPFQQFGNLIVALIVGLVVAIWLRKWWVAVAVVAAVALKLLGESLVKEVVQRSRPGSTIGDITMRGDVSAHGLSFVSGHAVIITAIAGLLTPILPRALEVGAVGVRRPERRRSHLRRRPQPARHHRRDRRRARDRRAAQRPRSRRRECSTKKSGRLEGAGAGPSVRRGSGARAAPGRAPPRARLGRAHARRRAGALPARLEHVDPRGRPARRRLVPRSRREPPVAAAGRRGEGVRLPRRHDTATGRSGSWCSRSSPTAGSG